MIDTHTPDAPDVLVRLIVPQFSSKCYQWELISCPYCGEKHRHGAK